MIQGLLMVTKTKRKEKEKKRILQLCGTTWYQYNCYSLLLLLLLLLLLFFVLCILYLWQLQVVILCTLRQLNILPATIFSINYFYSILSLFFDPKNHNKLLAATVAFLFFAYTFRLERLNNNNNNNNREGPHLPLIVCWFFLSSNFLFFFYYSSVFPFAFPTNLQFGLDQQFSIPI